MLNTKGLIAISEAQYRNRHKILKRYNLQNIHCRHLIMSRYMEYKPCMNIDLFQVTNLMHTSFILYMLHYNPQHDVFLTVHRELTIY